MGSPRGFRSLRRPTPEEFVIARPARTLVVAIRSPHAWGQIPTSAFSGLLGMTEFHRRGQPVLSAALCGKTTPWSSRSLPRKRSFCRPGDGVCVRNAFLLRSPFFKNLKTGACNFSRNRLYCVQGKKKCDCFPPVAAGDLEAVVFYCMPFTVSVFCSIHARSLSFATSTRDAMCRVGKSSRCRS